MSVTEQPVSGQEIIVPPRLPLILKEFCKAAIRTQPYDLLKWSSSYFRALADGEEPPTKFRLEYPSPGTTCGLTLGFLRILLRQFGDYNKSLPVETILRRWDCLCLDRRYLNLILMIGKFRRKCQVKKFLAIAVGLLGSSLFDTMVMICELFTHEPEGGSAMVPVTLFMEIYGYLAGLRCDGSERDPAGEDPTEFVTLDSESLLHQEYKEEKSSTDRVSITSQDTEADANLDLELVSRGDADSSATDITSELSERSSNRKKIRENFENGTKEDSSSEGTLKMETKEVAGGPFTVEVASEKRSDINDDKKSSVGENAKSFTSSSSLDEAPSNKKHGIRNVRSGRARKKMGIDEKLLKYYPNVPGIGPRLSAEEVASVAIWLAECARMQDGMVGPRNLRHMNCPPLDRQQIPES